LYAFMVGSVLGALFNLSNLTSIIVKLSAERKASQKTTQK